MVGHGSRHARVPLDSGAHTWPNPGLLCSFLEWELPGVPTRAPLLEGLRLIRLTNGQFVTVRQKSVPLGFEIHTDWGPVVREPKVFAIIPGSDCPMILGKVTVPVLRICPHAKLYWIAYGQFKCLS